MLGILSIPETETRAGRTRSALGQKVKHPGVVARAHNPRTPKVKAGRSGVQDHRPVLRELAATLGITTVSINKQTK